MLQTTRTGTSLSPSSPIARACARAARVPIATALISLFAQLAIPLPFTPVPLTGQTFAVALSALLLGRQQGATAVALYLAAGNMGMPVFAGGTSGIALGPTFGYLIGMLGSAWIIGGLVDNTPPVTFKRAWAYTAAGSACTFSFGLVGLLFFVPRSQVFSLGLIPFMPGDLIKTTLAASMAAFWTQRSIERSARRKM